MPQVPKCPLVIYPALLTSRSCLLLPQSLRELLLCLTKSLVGEKLLTFIPRAERGSRLFTVKPFHVTIISHAIV